jgi:hypothetical protein
MQFAGLLEKRDAHRIRAYLQPVDRFVDLGSVRDISAIDGTMPVVLDLGLTSAVAWDIVVERVRVFGTPVILYAPLRMSNHLLDWLGRGLAADIVLREHEDAPQRIYRRIRAVDEHRIGTEVLRRLSSRLRNLPPSIREAVLAMFDIGAIRNVNDLAISSNYSERWLRRSFKEVGITSLASLVQVSMLCRLSDKHLGSCLPRPSLHSLARKEGIRSMRAVNDMSKRFLRQTLRSALTEIDHYELVDKFAHSITVDHGSEGSLPWEIGAEGITWATGTNARSI